MDSSTLWSSSKDDSYEGFVKMTLKCVEPSNKLVFHSKDLTLNSVKLLDPVSNSEIKILSSSSDTLTDFVTLNLEQNCEKDKSYALEIFFNGKIITNLYGFYKSSYKRSDGTISS